MKVRRILREKESGSLCCCLRLGRRCKAPRKPGSLTSSLSKEALAGGVELRGAEGMHFCLFFSPWSQLRQGIIYRYTHNWCILQTRAGHSQCSWWGPEKHMAEGKRERKLTTNIKTEEGRKGRPHLPSPGKKRKTTRERTLCSITRPLRHQGHNPGGRHTWFSYANTGTKGCGQECSQWDQL